MTGPTQAVQRRWKIAEHHVDRAGRTALAIAGALFSLVGLVLAIGGYISPINGSAFQMLAGLGLIVSGALVARRQRAGAWTYMLVFTATVSWSLRNIENGSNLIARLVGPTLLLGMIAVLMPMLCGWRARQTLTAFFLVMAATVGLAASSLPTGPLARETATITQFLDALTKGVLK